MSLSRDLYLSRRPLAGFFAVGAAWSVFFAQMPVIKSQVGASDGDFGLVLLLSSFGAITAMWLAPACRRFAGGLAMPMAICTLALGMFWGGASMTLTALTLALFLCAVGSGVIDVLVNARVSEIEEEQSVTLMNLNHALYSFAYAGGALVTAALRSADVPPIPIFTGLVVFLLAMAWCAHDMPPKIEDSASPAARLSVPLVVLTGMIVMIAFLAEAATEGWSALHLERTLGGSPGQGALGPALLGLMMGIGRLCGHWLSQHIRDTRLMLMATLVSAAGIALAGMAPTVHIGLIGFGIGGLGISVVAPLALSLIGRVVPARHRLAAIGRVSVIGYGAFFLGPPMMGLIAEGFGLRMSFYVIAAMLAAVALGLIPALARRAA